jgi:GDPmannose 4,6-dehydratase
MKALVFGVGGQDGHYLAQLLLARGVDVVGVSRSPGDWIVGDVGDLELVERLVREQRPDYVFHLAAHSTTRHEALFDNHRAISTGTLNILESAKRHAPRAKIFLSGSAMQFANDGTPIDEATPFAPLSHYAVARIQSVLAGRYYRRAFELPVYVGYFFNHDSPLRSEQHVNQKIVAAVTRIAAGSGETLQLGNIEVRKEFNFAGDAVEAIWTLLDQEQVFEAVIGSGRAYRIADWVDYCFRAIGRNWADHVELSSAFVPEYQCLVSRPALIESLGWKPKVDFEAFARLMLEGARDRRL